MSFWQDTITTMRILSIAENPLHSILYRTARPGGGQELGSLPLLEAEVEVLPEEVETVLATADLQAREVFPGQRLLGEVLAAECLMLAERGQRIARNAFGVLHLVSRRLLNETRRPG